MPAPADRAPHEAAVHPAIYATALLNLLADFGGEMAQLHNMQRAMLNILDDSARDKVRLESTERALFNILEDFDTDRNDFRAVQRASLNILEDIDTERCVRRKAEEQVRALNDALEARVRRRTAELMLANQELEAFAYSVAHDLRAPLRAIDGFSEIILEDCQDTLDTGAKDALRRVRLAAQRLGVLIDDMLTLARCTRGAVEIGQVDVSVIAELAVAVLRQADPARAIEVSIAHPAIAKGDSRLLRWVLDNLLSNAWKFTAHTADAAIRFASEVRDSEVMFHVQDNGAGFDMTFAHNLFVPFQRLHRASEFPGNGIGLATVKRIVARMGGRVWAEGEVNKGATFHFTLPRAATPTPETPSDE